MKSIFQEIDSSSKRIKYENLMETAPKLDNLQGKV
jgi:hypothetical protein